MTGLFLEQARSEYLDDVQDRYEKMKESSKAFLITQYGLSCFEHVPGGSGGEGGGREAYVARTFNFWIFPQPVPSSLGSLVPEAVANRRFTCEAGSMAFLSEQARAPCAHTSLLLGEGRLPPRGGRIAYGCWRRQPAPTGMLPAKTGSPRCSGGTATERHTRALLTGFDFNKCIGQGIPFMASRQRDNVLAQVERARERGASDQFSSQPKVEVTDEADLAFALAGPRFTADGHRGFIIRKVEQRNRAPTLVLIRAADAAAAAALERQQSEQQVAAVHEAAGFAAVFDLMRKSGKPAVGHNLAFDLAYSLISFAEGWLPNTWREYRQLARTWLPGGVYDTKYVSRQLPEVFGRETSLSDVYAGLVEGGRELEVDALFARAAAAAARAGATAEAAQLPQITHAAGFDKYRGLAPGAKAHEAGYDAYMTGAAFACLLPLLRAKAAADPGFLPRLGAAPPPPPSDGEQQQQQQQQQEEQQEAREGPGAPGPLAIVEGLKGRVNLTYSDMPYVALWGEDPLPQRPTAAHISWEEGGLSDEDGASAANGGNGGLRRGDTVKLVVRRLQQVLPRGEDGRPAKVRLTLLSRNTALAELEDATAVALLAAELPRSGGAVSAVPYWQYASERYARFASESAATAVAAVGTIRAAGAAADGDAQRAAKRLRTLEVDAAAGGGAGAMDVDGGQGAGSGGTPAASRCSIM
ncbi:hypothetical protein MNEG_3922 [Monoraphidium neglectum]|uniref:Uncharacterized protein n=1 Tax=Monoraphidium neglectum TaxID=145388 RepID=A0A0D2JZX9_9CHLO|nr:hypothetical protein MNEG_3922 [Monoraphidium neglectum]KIZ04038.1 hypothetical protein MNEG_3922 [Monoraphidium neglectum]|eukprot:XP_013903057.1 hypothetical protein MNEG_3922 [Monoraphidium neglectum]